ncbi:TIGR03756 family integrating conjugative element protein [Methylophaga sp.]|uniref:TIGR03756 family integrating conjugative element protein n=1 Tax=Methylophaga sp. TaxID=2024840 RepID=UPI0027191107|nr:TIGR03756 family integrating conjugative element protein [Methylophaga sp.]MDO8826010.1 TIGR03756 family integrating conjugative element protein [Methylophaga sp.]
MKTIFAFTFASLFSVSAFAETKTINTAEIVASAMSASCIDYQLVGVCFWLKCGKKCRVKTSPKIGHHNPDLVVSAHNGIGNNPWQEANGIVGSVSQSAVGSLINKAASISAGSNQTTKGSDLNTLKFKSSDAIGHPVASISMGLSCPSQATSFNPYFVSGTDSIAWRLGIPETAYPNALIPGRREIGNFPSNTWGSVYPRSGFIAQPSDAKAGAVIAQRVGDIVTRTGQPHVYQPLTGTPSYNGRIWPPGALEENTGKNGKWQMLVPKKSNSCTVFGDNDTTSIAGWDGNGNNASTGNYAWTLWRPYQCCKREGQFFLHSVNFKSYP